MTHRFLLVGGLAALLALGACGQDQIEVRPAESGEGEQPDVVGAKEQPEEMRYDQPHKPDQAACAYRGGCKE